ncbi:anaerobic ribonucleoside-triphosphate reductase activating protein [Xanthomonas massiliensis]|uniref:anaerobic ribonucleoside-triphosphate reductase activating protein n=1 Tax=Xanthomonas massiliensis TaxID=1720302 RepID=UPI000825E98F|nr:anaerobic ribonucleoside-triphosphate reductase activating protein [Xanthomonas massiliensis]
MIRIAGLVPLTSLDLPGRLAAVLFLQGCPWRCSYCHNPHLQPARAAPGPDFAAVLDFLRRRRGLLDGVVFSGGEPTLQPRLARAVAAVRALGFQTALHTAGMYPRRLAAVLPHLDWVGLDIKAPAALHAAVVGRAHGAAPALRSLQLLQDSGVDYECRTTWSPTLYPEAALVELARGLAARGVRRWVLQALRPGPGHAPDGLPPDLARLSALVPGFEYRPA